MQTQLLTRDKLVAVMNPNHRLVKRDAVRLSELCKERLIQLGAPSELEGRVAETFRRFAVSPNVQIETDTLDSIKKMVAQNLGVGIVPHMCVRKEERTGELIVRPIQEFPEERSLWIVYRRQSTEPSPVCQAFVKLVRSALNKGAATPPRRQ